MTAGPGRPLEGRRVLVTRRKEQSSTLVERLEAQGATVLAVPAIEVAPPEDTRPLDEALKGVQRFHGLILTSPNAVASVADHTLCPRLDPPATPEKVLAAVERLRAQGRPARAA